MNCCVCHGKSCVPVSSEEWFHFCAVWTAASRYHKNRRGCNKRLGKRLEQYAQNWSKATDTLSFCWRADMFAYVYIYIYIYMLVNSLLQRLNRQVQSAFGDFWCSILSVTSSLCHERLLPHGCHFIEPVIGSHQSTKQSIQFFGPSVTNSNKNSRFL